MPIEIERKFLVRSDEWRRSVRHSQRFCQGYLTHSDETSVRVRRAGDQGFITIKGAGRLIRPEYEYAIPVDEAEELLRTLCRRPLLEKTRHAVSHGSVWWAIDEFTGKNAGLVLAEIELASPEQSFPQPAWLGPEVTFDPRYRNSRLARSAAERVMG